MTEQAADHAPVQRGERGRYWDRWLEELRALPVEAPEWDGVAAFVAALQQLTEIKWQERDSRSRLQGRAIPGRAAALPRLASATYSKRSRR